MITWPSNPRHCLALTTPFLLLLLLPFPPTVHANIEEMTLNQEDASICAGAHDLQLLSDDIGHFECQTDELRHAFNCSNRFLPALPKTSQLPRGLEIMDFSNNRIKCLPKINNTVASCDVSNCSQGCLLEVHLQNNEIDYLNDEAFLNVTCLRFLDLSGNKLSSSSLQTQHFSKQSNLLHLDLHGNPLGRLSDRVLMSTYLSHLQSLNLSSCQLSAVGHSALDDFLELQTLDLSRNELEDLAAETFRGLSMLKTLDLRWNKLKMIPRDTFASLEHLEHLRLSHNQLVQIWEPAFSSPPPPVRALDLSDNHLHDLPVAALQELGQLEELDVSHNPVARLGAWHGVTSVRVLRLDFLSSLKTVTEDAFSPFPLLTDLSLRHAGQLSTIPATAFRGSSANLSLVRLDHNALVSLPQELLPWTQLSHLTLHDNPWHCNCSATWMMSLLGVDIRCQEPLRLRGQALGDLTPDELSCPKPLLAAKTVIALAINLVAVVVIAIAVWHRRRQLPCRWLRGTIGRYVMVHAKDQTMKEDVDSGHASGAEGEMDDLDLDLGSGSGSGPGSSSGSGSGCRARGRGGYELQEVREDGNVREETGVGRVALLLATFRHGYRRLARRAAESRQDLTLAADV